MAIAAHPDDEVPGCAATPREGLALRHKYTYRAQLRLASA